MPLLASVSDPVVVPLPYDLGVLCPCLGYRVQFKQSEQHVVAMSSGECLDRNIQKELCRASNSSLEGQSCIFQELWDISGPEVSVLVLQLLLL